VQDVAGRLYALTPDGGLKWVFRAGDGGGRAPLSVGADGTIYAAGSTPKDPAQTCATANLTNVDAVFAVNPDGTEKWVFKQTCQRLIAGPTAGPDGKIYAATEQGGLGAFALTDEGDEGALAWNNGTFSEPQSKGREVVFGPTSAGGAAAQLYLQFS
jgi:outer membrane protein assembly factor BamB